ncbi:MAG TPA: cation diffusion facilitator family transporter [Anaerolineales bacterium]|nr:cation diffusion facilitator family transporter [Anaerolineales bacterium]
MGNNSDSQHHHPGDHDHTHKHHYLPEWITSKLSILGHSHDHRGLASERAFRENEEGIRTVWIALSILLVTALMQMVIVYYSRSVSLFADTAHNVGDGLNSIPLLIAFYLARRIPTRRYTYGFGRAEDVAGILIVLSIAASAVIVFSQAIQRLMNPQPLTNLGWVAAAALLGFLGNEGVAILQIRVGRKIGSAAMVADGLHARTDGLTSLAVLVAAIGSWFGYPMVDPMIGLLIGIAIVLITWDAMKTIWYRLMDAVDPELIDSAEKVISKNAGVLEIRRIRMRWVGHCLHGEVYITVNPDLKTSESHQIAEQVRHLLYHEFPDLTDINVHVDPGTGVDDAHHELTIGHEPVPTLTFKD